MKTKTMLFSEASPVLHLNPPANRPGIKIGSKSLSVAVLLSFLSWPALAAEVSLESAPPVVVRTFPLAGATDVDASLTEIKVTFSKTMQDGTWSWSTWGEETFPEMVGQPRYLSDGRTCVLTVKLLPGKFYATWINSDKFKNFKDAGGRPAVPYLLSFRTAESAIASDASAPRATTATTPAASSEEIPPLLNDEQRAVLAWTDRQFRSYFDARKFDDWSEKERGDLESRLIDTLKGSQTRDYFQAINTLGAMRSTKGLPALRTIAYERADKNNRDRWMAIRSLGLIGDKADVPELIHLVYHGNVNTRWWAQISLVRITGQNFAKDWNAWGKWWNEQGGQPPFNPEIIRWWNGQPESDKLAESLEESDSKFLNGIKPQASAPKEAEERGQTKTGQPYLDQQLKLAKAGNYWAKFNLWEAFSKGKHEVAKNPTEADQWLAALVEGAYLARFEPVNGFTPKTPQEVLGKFNESSQLRSGRDSLGGASFFRTTKQGDKLIGSFLTASPDEFKAALLKNPSLKLISMEKVTPEMFLAYEASKQESLQR